MNALRVRRDAARRLEPLADGRRDTLDPIVVREPQTFGLTADERREHARALWRHGWQLWEIQTVLVVDTTKRPAA